MSLQVKKSVEFTNWLVRQEVSGVEKSSGVGVGKVIGSFV
jgi:hypothetical protein